MKLLPIVLFATSLAAAQPWQTPNMEARDGKGRQPVRPWIMERQSIDHDNRDEWDLLGRGVKNEADQQLTNDGSSFEGSEDENKPSLQLGWDEATMEDEHPSKAQSAPRAFHSP